MLRSYVRLLERRRFALLVAFVWLCIFGAGIAAATRVFANLKLQARCCRVLPSQLAHAARQQIEPIKGDTNDLARSALVSSFPALAVQENTYVLLQAADGATPLATLPAARTAAAQLSAFAAHGIASGLLTSDSGASYFTYADAGLVQQAAGAVSADGTAILVRFSTTEGYIVSVKYTEFLTDLRQQLKDVLSGGGGLLHGGITGDLPISSDSGASITMDIAQSDAVTITLSFLLLALALRSIRLIALTGVALCAAFGGAFLLIWPLTNDMSTPNFVTSLVISTLVSLSLDYSLFLLSHLKARMLCAGAQKWRADRNSCCCRARCTLG